MTDLIPRITQPFDVSRTYGILNMLINEINAINQTLDADGVQTLNSLAADIDITSTGGSIDVTVVGNNINIEAMSVPGAKVANWSIF